jgi:hypothetical protein
MDDINFAFGGAETSQDIGIRLLGEQATGVKCFNGLRVQRLENLIAGGYRKIQTPYNCFFEFSLF